MVCLVAISLSHQLDKAWSLLCVQSKSQQRKLVQSTIDAKSLGLLKMLVMGPDLKLSCSGCFLHGIVADAPLELLVTLMKAAGTALNTQHPILKTYVIHEVPLHVTNGQSPLHAHMLLFQQEQKLLHMSSCKNGSRIKSSRDCLLSH